ncbi:hypothetical protein [Parvularcula sp. IMCC14364]|uniref:hypothetical protein n=1 Tax=Parvularcula sp. IMCC14364 TaxID=3067902 RepID=UPI0027415802|nr:hypothetical protein [Parvularcula sp. IMCC14364]
MRHPSLQKACLSLEKATQAYETLCTCRDFKTFRFAWADFLQAHNHVFSMLANWAKDRPKHNAWYGCVRKIRREDELLSYVHQARNAFEHGTQEIHGESGPKFVYKLKGPMLLVPNGIQILGEVTESQEWKPPSPELHTFINSKKSYAPPKRHLGSQIPDPTPQKVAELGITFAELKLQEAEERELEG